MEKQKRGHDYATVNLDQVYQELNSGQSGLSSEQAHNLLEKFGLNTIQKTKREPQFKIFIKNFVSLMAILLWVSGFVAIFAGTAELGIAIWCVNIINGLFSFYQQHAAQKATDSLLKMLPI